MSCGILSTFSSGILLVHDCEDESGVIVELRSKYRIVGNLIGSMPHFQQQNVFNGIPLLLCEEEVALLLKLGVIRLLKGDTPFRLPTKEEVDEFEHNRES